MFRWSDCLCMLLFIYARLPGVRSLLPRISRVCRSSARQVTLWSYSSIPNFYYALVCPTNNCIGKIGNMWFGCSAWGRNLIPFDHPGNIHYAYLLLSHARRRGLDRDSHKEVESYLIMNNNKVATLIYIWVDWLRHLGNPVLPVSGNPGVPMWFFLRNAPRHKGIIRLFMLETSVCSHKPLWALA